MYNRFTGGDVEPYTIGATKFYVLTEDEVNGMKECIRDQGERIKELEADVASWREMYMDTRKHLDAGAEELAVSQAAFRVEHGMRVRMTRELTALRDLVEALTIGRSQQEH